MANRICISLLMTILAFPEMAAAQSGSRTIGGERSEQQIKKRADFVGRPASNEARQLADWVVDGGNNRSLPFIIVDKMMARIFVFDADGRLNGMSVALVGLAKGNVVVPGIGDRKLSTIRPEERITPAGRFEASLGHDLAKRDILWVDYSNSIALHRVVTSNPAEHRLQRLGTDTLEDKRISYGCINVPVAFFESIVLPVFAGRRGVVYILPETKSIDSFLISLNR